MATPGAENPESAPTLRVGRRKSQRARLHLLAVLGATTGNYRVVLRNLSSAGAMVEGREVPRVGRTVAIRRTDLDALATVIWSENGRCGLAFDEPLSLDQVLRVADSPRDAPSKPTNGEAYLETGRRAG